jgi:hypothetical protein
MSGQTVCQTVDVLVESVIEAPIFVWAILMLNGNKGVMNVCDLDEHENNVYPFF